MSGNAEGRSALRVASLDIGTNSVRLLVADVEANGGFLKVFEDRRIARLGQGLQGSGRLSEGAIGRTVESLRAFVGEAKRHGVLSVLAVATSAVRDALNGERFVYEVYEAVGLDVRVLSGLEEAQWMVLGVSMLWPDPPRRWMAVDLGGGSTELVLVEGRSVKKAVSVPAGMVRLTEETVWHDPPLAIEVERCRQRSRESLGQALREILSAEVAPEIFVGTAGTITTLAALAMRMDPYDGERVNGFRLSRETVGRWASSLGDLSAAQRRDLPGMEPGREDVILAGALMVNELLDLADAREMVVSDYGLLEGAALVAAGYRPACETGRRPMQDLAGKHPSSDP